MNILNNICHIFGTKKTNEEQEENSFYISFLINNTFTAYYDRGVLRGETSAFFNELNVHNDYESNIFRNKKPDLTRIFCERKEKNERSWMTGKRRYLPVEQDSFTDQRPVTDTNFEASFQDSRHVTFWYILADWSSSPSCGTFVILSNPDIAKLAC